MGRIDISSQTYGIRLEPRGLSRAQASEYIGISTSLFDQMVADGRMPTPKRINSRTVWDKHQIDRSFEALSSEDSDNPWDRKAS